MVILLEDIRHLKRYETRLMRHQNKIQRPKEKNLILLTIKLILRNLEIMIWGGSIKINRVLISKQKSIDENQPKLFQTYKDKFRRSSMFHPWSAANALVRI